MLLGRPISPGIGRGQACRVQEWQQPRVLEPGRILVCKFPLPVFAPLLQGAAGLVSAYGGRDGLLAKRA